VIESAPNNGVKNRASAVLRSRRATYNGEEESTGTPELEKVSQQPQEPSKHETVVDSSLDQISHLFNIRI